jgi:hypothetical protein
MDMPSRVWSHVLATLGSREDKAWEYNENDVILIMDMHKLFASIDYDDEKQISHILTHVHLGVVDHVIIHAYVKSCTWDGYNGCSITLYHPINVGCFSELDDIVRNPPSNMLVTCRSRGDVDDDKE